jgi:predicted O-methyltransferase YrrM
MFTEKWFDTTGKENFRRYVTPLSGEFLEIGCFEGRATCWMLNNTKANVTVIDTFKGSPEMVELGVQMVGIKQRFLENIRQWKDRVTIYEGESQDVLRIINKKYNFIYVDGSHYAGDALRDIVYSWGLLKPGGIMIMDDYIWGGDNHDAPVTRWAIDAFLRCFQGAYQVLAKNAQCVVLKIWGGR